MARRRSEEEIENLLEAAFDGEELAIELRLVLAPHERVRGVQGRSVGVGDEGELVAPISAGRRG